MRELVEIIEANGGYLMRHQLNDLGHSDPSIRALVKEGVLRKVRHGTYVSHQAWLGWTETQRHLVVTRSVLNKLGAGFAASHGTAAAAHGFDLYGEPLDRVHLVRLDGRSGRREAGVTYHHGTTIDDDLIEVGGLLVVRGARAVFDTCTTSGIEAGMVVTSSALHTGRVTRDELITEGQQHPHWLGARTARLTIALSDGRLESVGESRSLFMMWKNHVPRPDMQTKVQNHRGVVIARTDFEWIGSHHTGEFDGKVKYGRLNPYSYDPGRTIVDEKEREDRIRETGRGMTRWVWADLDPKVQAETATRIGRGLDQSRRLYTRNATHIA
jgi:hypothetical protein